GTARQRCLGKPNPHFLLGGVCGADTSDMGSDFACSLSGEAEDKNYFCSLTEIISKLGPLQSQPTTKLNTWLNTVFKGN
ncbi:hypothetical protein RYA99_24100, partial [Pseudomonas syringae pv. actinidifoliorum]|nr:hypothetical protein [Pseudomonas syringae pv. actinidifoliorum]MDU8522553.1 hypothetical protein [Pseudomonas syringae pv. actinidifoliorum]MDU8529243.1 hypothetical protein [Pseudomonas syringae pv. actinidifoliorum]